MSKAWKWILGIVAVLVIVGVVVGAVFVWQNHAPLALASRLTRPRPYAQPAPGTPAAPGAPAVPNNQTGQGAPYGFGRGERGFLMTAAAACP